MMNLMLNKSMFKEPKTLLLLVVLMSGQVHAACHANIRLVKPDSAYADNLDGTVTDIETGLTWAKCSLGQSWVDNTPNDGGDDQCSGTVTTYVWKAALDAVQSANGSGYLGRTDWRLPNKNELESLVEIACVNPAINSSRFPATPVGEYWTSSPYAPLLTHAWRVNFRYGNVDVGDKSSNLRVRVVTGGQ